MPKENEKIFGKLFLTEEEIIQSIGRFLKRGKIVVDLCQILGEGGEGLVVEQDLIFMENCQKCAVKLTHYETGEPVFGGIFFDHLRKSNEFYIGTRELNEFRIKHLFNTIVKVNSELFQVTGKFLILLKFSIFLLKTNDFFTLTLDERLEMIQKVAQGINVKHVIHFDLKPTNIFIKEDNGKWNGELVIADFGIGRHFDANDGYGTGGFASPEQIVSRAFKEADIYSLAKRS